MKTLFWCAVGVLALRTTFEIVAGARWSLGVVRSWLARSTTETGDTVEFPSPPPSPRRRRTRKTRTNYLEKMSPVEMDRLLGGGA